MFRAPHIISGWEWFPVFDWRGKMLKAIYDKPTGNQIKWNFLKNGKEELKLLLFADMILYIENPKDATRKLLEVINEYGKVLEYEINTEN